MRQGGNVVSFLGLIPFCLTAQLFFFPFLGPMPCFCVVPALVLILYLVLISFLTKVTIEK